MHEIRDMERMAKAHVEGVDAHEPQARFGQWMQTFTGGKFWPMDPRADEVNLRDIAHSLGMQTRYAGHCRRFYSVGEHSVLIARWLKDHGEPPEVVLAGLMHDAPEAYLVDVPRPLKAFLTGYKAAEERAWVEVAEWLGISPTLPAIVHEADNRILNDERAQNMAPAPETWGYSGDPLGITLKFWSPEEAEAMFVNAFHQTTSGVL